ncbi:MAG: MlaD family protein [Deltaproteobacteria bacterium]|nr:MlaD family protein [Deltaproteobacteria bacterium]
MKRKEIVQAAKVGTLVVFAVVAAYFLWRAVDEGSQTREGYRVYALLPNAQGLIPKSRVTIAGISVGRIERIRLEGSLARVDLVINPDVALYEDATIQRSTASLLGEYFLAISPGTEGKRRLVDGDRIATVIETPSTGEILEHVGAIAASVRQVARQLERSFGTDEAGRQMSEALRNLSESLARVNSILEQNQESIRRTVENVEAITRTARPELERILEHIEAIAREIRSLVERNQGEIDRGVKEADDMIASIRRAADRLDKVLADLGEVTERTAAGEGTIGRLTTDSRLMDELESSAEGLADVLGGISRLRTIVELRSEYNFLANTFKNYFTFRILPREGRAFYLQLIDDPRGRIELSSVQVRRSPVDPGEPEFYEEQRITTTDALVFSFMLAQRVHFATFRFGILESSGGLGLDLHLLDDSLEITGEVFQIAVSRLPRLRFRAAYELLPTLFVLAGIDDPLNERTVDFFIGAMLRFDDQDLVPLLPFFGGAIGSLAR